MGCSALYFQVDEAETAAPEVNTLDLDKAPLMSDSPSRDDVKEMIEDAVERKSKQAFEDGFEKWMSKYELKPQHFVFLNSEYHKAVSQQNLIRRVLITAVVTTVIAATFWMAEEWIKQIVITHYSHLPPKP